MSGETVRDAVARQRDSRPEHEQDPFRRELEIHTAFGVLRVANPGFTHLHDLHHLALGADSSFRGEVIVSSWEIVTGPPSWAVWRLNMMGVVAGLLRHPALVLQTMFAARRGRNLYALGASYEQMLDWSTEDLTRFVRRDARHAW